MAEYCLFHGDYYELHVDHFIEWPWTVREPLRVGDVPKGLGTPDYYCCVERNGEPDFVVSVYGNGPSVFNGFTSVVVDATFWQTWLVAGSMTQVHFISLAERREERTEFLKGYFCGLYPNGDNLFVCSHEMVYCFDKELNRRWESSIVGINGVEITSIGEDVILGRGAMYDDSWPSFTLSRATGEMLRS